MPSTDTQRVNDMATAKTTATEPRPLIQIDDEIREMNDEEYAEYLLITAGE